MASWRAPGSILEASGLDFGGFQEHPGRFSEVPWLYFSTFFVTFRYNACNGALTALLDFPRVSLLFFWCGGLCAAHRITETALMQWCLPKEGLRIGICTAIEQELHNCSVTMTCRVSNCLITIARLCMEHSTCSQKRLHNL